MRAVRSSIRKVFSNTPQLPIQRRAFVLINWESSSALTSPLKSTGLASFCLNSLYTGKSSLLMLNRSLSWSFSFSPYSAKKMKYCKYHLQDRGTRYINVSHLQAYLLGKRKQLIYVCNAMTATFEYHWVRQEKVEMPPPPPHIFIPNWGPKGRKNFLGDLPPLSKGPDDCPPPPLISRSGSGTVMVKEGDRGGEVAKILLSVISTPCDSLQLLNAFRVQQCSYTSIMFSPAEENACSAGWIDSRKVVLILEFVDQIRRCNHSNETSLAFLSHTTTVTAFVFQHLTKWNKDLIFCYFSCFQDWKG